MGATGLLPVLHRRAQSTSLRNGLRPIIVHDASSSDRLRCQMDRVSSEARTDPEDAMIPLPLFAEIGTLVDRGVWYAPVLGPEGELIQFAATSEHRLAAAPIYLPATASPAAHRAAAILLGERLDQVDPVRDDAPIPLTLIRSASA